MTRAVNSDLLSPGRPFGRPQTLYNPPQELVDNPKIAEPNVPCPLADAALARSVLRAGRISISKRCAAGMREALHFNKSMALFKAEASPYSWTLVSHTGTLPLTVFLRQDSFVPAVTRRLRSFRSRRADLMQPRDLSRVKEQCREARLNYMSVPGACQRNASHNRSTFN
jgi:hypothetical protein